MNINKHPMLRQIYDHSLSLEELPPSDKQTALAIQSMAIGSAVELLVDRITSLESRLSACEAENKELVEALEGISSDAWPIRGPLKVLGGDARAADVRFEGIRIRARADRALRAHAARQKERKQP